MCASIRNTSTQPHEVRSIDNVRKHLANTVTKKNIVNISMRRFTWAWEWADEPCNHANPTRAAKSQVRKVPFRWPTISEKGATLLSLGSSQPQWSRGRRDLQKGVKWNDSMHGPQVVTEQVFALGRTCCCGRIMLAVRASSNARSEAGFSTKARNAWGCVAICFATSAAQSSRQVFWPHSRERLRSVLVFYVVPPVNIPLRPQLSASSLMFWICRVTYKSFSF